MRSVICEQVADPIDSVGLSARRRIAMVAACEFPSSRGSQALVAGIAAALHRRGHDVHAVACSGESTAKATAGVSLHHAPRLPGVRPHDGPHWGRILQDMLLLGTLYRVVSRYRIEVMHAHNYEGAIAACMVRAVTGVPVVYHAHNVMSEELEFYARRRHWRALARGFGFWLDRNVPRRADHTIVLNQEVATFLQGCAVPQQRLSVMPPVMPVAAPLGHPTAECGKKDFVVAYAGNLDPYQGLDLLAAAFAEFLEHAQDARLRLVTHDTRWQEHIGELIRTLLDEGRAEVVVVADHQGAQRALESADVLVCPRRSWSGYPMKLLNYLATGRPIVAAVGAGTGLVDGVSALLFDESDCMTLGIALRRLHRDPFLASALGRAAQEVRRQMPDAASTAAELEKIYESLRPIERLEDRCQGLRA